MSQPILEIRELAVSFGPTDAHAPRTQAVADASLSVHPSQALAVVGESGCGKSVTALSVLQLVPCPPARYDSGSILFEGEELLRARERELRRIRGGRIAMIFQEPMTSLNPVVAVGEQIVEAVRLHRRVGRREAHEIAVDAMRDVGIAEPEIRVRAYPHQLSGGMRQRVMIAMALACQPALLLADEPTTALDVTIQAQILALLRELRESRGMGLMLITHNLGVVAENADVVCVMYAGRVVEYATVLSLFDRPLHPYTRGLLAAMPRMSGSPRRLTTVEDVVRDPLEFKQLPGSERGVVPWWPKTPEDSRPRVPTDRPACALREVEPDHWVCLWNSDAAESLPMRAPDIPFRRQREEPNPRLAETSHLR